MTRKSNLSMMSVDALFKLRDDVARVLGDKAAELQAQFSKLTGSAKKRGRPAGKRSRLKGKKVAGPRSNATLDEGDHAHERKLPD